MRAELFFEIFDQRKKRDIGEYNGNVGGGREKFIESIHLWIQVEIFGPHW
jgi:hypothetical protein